MAARSSMLVEHYYPLSALRLRPTKTSLWSWLTVWIRCSPSSLKGNGKSGGCWPERVLSLHHVYRINPEVSSQRRAVPVVSSPTSVPASVHSTLYCPLMFVPCSSSTPDCKAGLLEFKVCRISMKRSLLTTFRCPLNC
jgi:hypothetical protein